MLETSQARSRSDALFTTSERNAELVHAMGMTGDLARRWTALQHDAHHLKTRVSDRIASFSVLSKTIRMGLQSAMLGLGSALAITGEATAGVMIAATIVLARALAPKPRTILMDEPFSGLDNRLRDGIREETISLLKEEGTSVLLVTHDPEEAMRVGDSIALMRRGKIVQSGAPYNIYNTPVDREAASFFSDINVISGRVKGAQVDTPFGAFLAPGFADGTRIEIVIRPQHLKLDFDRQGKGPLPTEKDGVPARGTVARARFVGNQSLVDVAMDIDGTQLTATVPAVFLPQVGTPLWLSMRRDRCYVFEAA
jgi:ABC-type Fe3+/spermidine/putrescine transport system ATPase subunit